MNKKIWVHSPATFILLGLILVTAIVSYFKIIPEESIGIFLIVIAIISIALVVVLSIRFKSYLKRSVTSAVYAISPDETNLFQNFPLPAVITSEKGDVIWFNELFSSKVTNTSELYGENITNFLSGYTISDLKVEGLDVAYDGKLFTVFYNKIDRDGKAIYTLYFVDNTYFKKVSNEYILSRPVVCLALFDNMEELAQASNSGKVSQISGKVEYELEKWVTERKGFIRKINSDRYLIFFEERQLSQIISNKFVILDAIRNIKLDERLYATISIGIGRDGRTFNECHDRARQALDMALGRGGDQVAIKSDEGYDFYGGTAKGMEKRSRVRTRIVANALSRLIVNCDTIFIMGHRFSDLDSVGAAAGVWDIITRIHKKKAYVVVNKETTLAKTLVRNLENNGMADFIISPEQSLILAKAAPSDNTMLVVVDTHSKDFLECNELYNLCRDVVVIDHHRKMVNYIDRTVVFFHEPFASSASEMVTELVEYMGDGKINRPQAEALLSGIMLDTKNFVLKTGVRTFDAGAILCKNGADTVEVKRMFSSNFSSYKAKTKIVSCAQMYNNTALSIVDESLPELRMVSAQAADELLSIKGVDASFVMFAVGNGVSISARSLGKLNVQLIMERLGGGGHLTMAGTQINNCSIEEGKQKLIEAIDKSIKLKTPDEEKENKE